MKEYAIFDLDGTLIDSFDCTCRNVNKTLAHFGSSVCTNSQFEEYRHKGLNELFSFAVETMNGRISMASFKSIFDKMHFDDCLEGVTVIEKTRHLLEDAKQRGLGIIVLTNKKQEIAEKICSVLFPSYSFMGIVGRNDTFTSKYDNIVFYMSYLKILPTHCLFFCGNDEIDANVAKLLNVEYYKIN